MREFEPTLVTIACPDKETAIRLSKLAVGHHFAACAQITSNVESYFWWEGELENQTETLVTLKTDSRFLPKIEALVKEHHPYTVAEIAAVPLLVNEAYLDWMKKELGSN